MKRKPSRGRAFKAALSSATKRLAKAQKERTQAQKRLLALDAEIPALQSTISALQRQIHPNDVTFKNSKTGLETATNGTIRVPAIPPELAKLVGPQDMTGFGSIVHDPSKPIQLSDDELLPDPEGTPLTPDA